jgi:drug/metabolite transporter (DMT)-like permease
MDQRADVNGEKGPAVPAARRVDAATRPLDAIAIGVTLILCVSWGFNQVAVKLALPDIPPMIQAAVRSVGAAILVTGWAWLRGVPLLRRDGTLLSGIVTGALFGLEFILVYSGLVWTTATRAVLFVYLAPFFVVLGARWLLPGDRFSRLQWSGLLLSFAGMIVAFGIPTPSANPREMLGDLLMVAGAIAWAATTLCIKVSALNRTSQEKTMLYQLVVSAPMFVVVALLSGERMGAMPSAQALGALAYQTVWVVGVTFLAWFALILRYSASRLSAFTFLTPIFGVLAGHFVLGEALAPGFLVALALVVGGLILVNRPTRAKVLKSRD